MLSDHQLFEKLCAERGMIPPHDVLDAMKVASSTGTLRLSCLSILVPISEIIAQILESSRTIKNVDFSDSMLLAKSLDFIFNALCVGSNIIYLNLKGNNIRGPVVQKIGQVLQYNKTIRVLRLEWNNLGTDFVAFSSFCDGLSKNHTIEELDIKYNQISPHSAEDLFKVIKYNKSLKSLDLAWNTLGLHGGQMILRALQENKNLISLDLKGNCLPDELVDSIQKCLRDNTFRISTPDASPPQVVSLSEPYSPRETDRQTSSSDTGNPEGTRHRTSRKKVRNRNPARASPLDGEMNATRSVSDSDPEGFFLSERYNENLRHSSLKKSPNYFDMIDQFPVIEASFKIIQDKNAAVSLLTNELRSKEMELTSANLQISQMQEEIDKLKLEHEAFSRKKSEEIEKLQNTYQNTEKDWEKCKTELEEAYNEALIFRKELESKAKKYEKEIHKSSIEILSLKEKFLSSTREYEDLISQGKTEIHQLQRELKEKENKQKIEMNLVKTTLKETTEALEKCQAQLLKNRNELGEAAERESNIKIKLNEMEYLTKKCTRAEDFILKMKQEKDSLEKKYGDAERIIGTLQRQVTSLQGELIEPQKRYNFLKDELDQEREKTDRLKQELIEERSRLREQSEQLQQMNLQITTLNARINEIQTNHSELLREKDTENNYLKDIIARKEKDLNDLRAEEVQRAGQLYAAFNKYMSTIGANNPL